MIEQQFYTSTAKTITGGAGFGVKAQSPGIEPAIALTLEQYSRYHAPHSLAPQDIDAMPISLSFYRLGDDLWGITHCKYVGLDHTGTRWGNFFAHSLVCDEEALRTMDAAPIRLLGSDLWATEDAAERTELPRLGDPPTAAQLSVDEATTFINAVPDRERRLAELLQAVVSYSQTGRRVIIVDEPDAMADWLRALTIALPVRYRRDLSFTTYHRDPNALNFVVTCTTLDGDFRFTDADYRFQFCIFNHIEGRYSEDVEPGRGARALADAIGRKDSSMLSEISAYADRLKSDTPLDIDGIVCLYELGETRPENRDDGVVKGAGELLKRAAPGGGEYAWEASRNLAREAMACNRRSHLALLIPVCYALSTTDSMELLREDCSDYVRRHLPTASARDVIELFALDFADLPEVRDVLATRSTPDVWTAFLEKAEPSPELVKSCMEFLCRAGEETLRAGDLTLWRAFRDWAQRNGSELAMAAAGTVMDRSDLPLSRCRALVDTLGSGSLGNGFDTWLQMSLGVLLASVSDGSTDWEDDLLRCTDALLSVPNPAEFLAQLLAAMSAQPAVAVRCLEQVLSARPDLVDECATHYVNAGLTCTELVRALPGAAGIEPLLSAVLKRPSTAAALAEILQSMLSSRWPTEMNETRDRLLADGLSNAMSAMRSPDEIVTFLQSVPALRQIPWAHGQLLAMQAGLTRGLTIYETAEEILALDTALAVTTDADLSAGAASALARARVSALASRAVHTIRSESAWGKTRDVLGRIEQCKPTSKEYGVYIECITHALIECDPKLPLKRLHDALEAMFVESLVESFVAECTRIIGKSVRKRDRLEIVGWLIDLIGERGDLDPRSARATAELVRLVPKADLEDLCEAKQERFRDGTPEGRWWRAVQREASKGFWGRILGR